MKCKDRVAIVTGAAGNGMGRSTALTLAREGARVVVNYRNSADSANQIARHITGRGGQAVAVGADVVTADGCKALVDAAVEAFGQVDICVFNSGCGWHPEPPHKLDAQASLDDANCELAPIYHLMPLVLPGMYQRKWGRLIGISLARPFASPAYAYNVAKAGRTHALLAACGRAWREGVTVNVIAPGPVAALDSLDAAVEHCDHGAAWAQRENISPQDIAESVAFLCSDAARYISGCELPFLYH